jgi:N-acetylglutamate synthase-like GNAT family acetyltransferase
MTTDCTIEEHYREEEYGRLLMSFLINYASLIGLPIKLYSVSDAVKFYKKLGFKEVKKDNCYSIKTMFHK